MTLVLNGPSLLPNEQAIKNLDSLATFEIGDKPVTRQGYLEKENRECLVVIRRGWEKSFDPQIIEDSFFTGKEIFKKSEVAILHKDSSIHLQQIDHICKSSPKFLRGLENVEQTYRNESQGCYYGADQKLRTAERLNDIYNKYKDFTKENKVKDHELISKGKSSAMAFWKKIETNSKTRKAFKGRIKMKQSYPQYEEIIDYNPKVKVERTSSKLTPIKNRITKLLCRMAEETLKDIKKNKDKPLVPYTEKSKLKERLKEITVKFDCFQDELSVLFEEKKLLVGDQIRNFESDLKRKKETVEDVSGFNIKLIDHISECVQEETKRELVDESEWEVEEDLIDKRRILVEEAVKQPLVRSISVYQSLNRIKKKKKVNFEQVVPTTLNEEFKELLAQRRTATQYSTDGAMTDDDFSDCFETDEE